VPKSETAVLAGGCFWCTEALFSRLRGVTKVESGYTGGTVANPTYEQVCTGATGHAECVRVTFDPAVISYETLLDVFWHTHDPTTLNRQGADIGTQYRSAVFFNSTEQKDTAERMKKMLEESKEFSSPIVTEISPFTEFYPAEAYHERYFEQHGSAPYCALVIAPKINKLMRAYGALTQHP